MDKNELLKFITDNIESITAEDIISMADIYKPELYKIINYLFGFYKDLVSNEDYYKTISKDYSNFFNALISEGFDRAEALQIIINKGSFLNKLNLNNNNNNNK